MSDSRTIVDGNGKTTAVRRRSRLNSRTLGTRPLPGYVGPLVSALSVAVCLLGAEWGLRRWAPIQDPYQSYRARNPYIRSHFPIHLRLTTEAEEGLPGLQGAHVFSTNNMGFRGDELVMPKPANEFRVFIVGGSTTECFYLDDLQTMPAVVQRVLSAHAAPGRVIKVYNAGKAGHRIDDHVSLIAHRIAHLQPDLLVVFCGVNDVSASIYHYDYLHFNYWGPNGEFPTSLVLKMLLMESQLARRLYYAAKRLTPTEKQILEEIPLKTNVKQAVKLRKSTPVSDAKPEMNVSAYETNLKTLIGVARGHEVPLVFMTQVSTWMSPDPAVKEWQYVLYRYGTVYREDVMDESLETLNGVMRRVASERHIPVYDLARELPKSTDYFYDDIHFNVKGAETAGTGLASFLMERGVVPTK